MPFMDFPLTKQARNCPPILITTIGNGAKVKPAEACQKVRTIRAQVPRSIQELKQRRISQPSIGGPGINGLRAGGRNGLRVGGRINGATAGETAVLVIVVVVVIVN